MLAHLRQRQRDANPIRVGVVGAGNRGRGVAAQVEHAPGMQLVFLADRSELALKTAAKILPRECRFLDNPFATEPIRLRDEVLLAKDADGLLYNQARFGGIDVLVEASGCIGDGVRHALSAMEQGAHVVIANSLLDVTYGSMLQQHARGRDVICTSDAGSYHGALLGLLEEMELRGLDLVEAGALIAQATDPIKTPDQVRYHAVRRQMDPVTWCSQVDGTALNLEMALVSRSTGLGPEVFGMRGTAMDDLQLIAERARNLDRPSLNYVIGANPSEGAYALAHCEDPEQARYLRDFRLGDSPYFLFARHQRTQHLEVTFAIAKAVLYAEPVLRQDFPRAANVFAFAKRDLNPGTEIHHATGGGEVYGLIERGTPGQEQGWVPIGKLEGYGDARPRVTQMVKQGEPLTMDAVEFEESPVISALHDVEIGLDRMSGRRQATGGVELHS